MDDRRDDLLADYEHLGALLLEAEGAAAAALVRERRILRKLLAELSADEGSTVADKLAGNVTRLDTGRRGRTSDPGPTAGRRKSG